MKQCYYQFEIDVILKGVEETTMENPPMDCIAMSRDCIQKKYGQIAPRPVARVDDDGVRLLMREFEISRAEAEDAMVRADDDIYMAAVSLLK